MAGVYRLARSLLELAHVACYLVVNILNSNLTAGIAHNTQFARAWRSRYESRANRPGRPIVRQVEPKLTLSILEYEPALGVLYVAEGLPELALLPPTAHEVGVARLRLWGFVRNVALVAQLNERLGGRFSVERAAADFRLNGIAQDA